ncbi:MAG: hypoxanthine phosphoribosyltransferase [Armatimonadetes bacterium]|nr:MAG: hypoxanthine phosphoribosyltransferase [Armatimonadota bacterium]
MSDDFVEVIAQDTVARRVAELADEINADHPDGELMVIGILKGSLIFMKDLLDHLPLDSTPQFLALTRFGSEGRVSVTLDVDEPLDNRDVLLVLEIVDTGLTLLTIRNMLEAKGARSVRTVALLDKAPRRIVDVPVEYRGFEVGDEYLLGYGLDWKGLFRNLRSVWAVMNMPRFLDEPNTFVDAAYATGQPLRTE